MSKCSVDSCDKICTYKIFTTCPDHTAEMVCQISHELYLEAFPELNGRAYKEPTNKYAKWLKDTSGINDE
jgi:hypothetical protein